MPEMCQASFDITLKVHANGVTPIAEPPPTNE